MAKIREINQVPPGGYWFETPSGLRIESSSRQGLGTRVFDYYRANNMSVKGLDEAIDDQICSRAPLGFCVDGAREYMSPVQKAAHFAGALANWVALGFKLASKELYEERKATCDACPYWRGESMFGFGSCSVCGCSRLKLFLPSEKCPLNKWR